MNKPIIIGVGAIIEDESGRVLLVKHKPDRGGYWQGKWICPGGALELGETIEEGIKREVKEETRLDIDLLEPLSPFDRIVKMDDQVLLHVVYIDYRARLAGGELKPQSDIGEAIWVQKERIPNMWDELHEDTRKLFQRARIVE
ncbi:MAG: NUDIX domain-containing protein [Dehalococcoidales bacterium]|nr:NUDIX domain-containing protein [Dehalococcoidales bacterium]